MRQPNIIDDIIAKNMRDIRKVKQMNLKDVAPKIGVSYQQLRKYEICSNRISASMLWKLSIVYRTPIQRFFEN